MDLAPISALRERFYWLLIDARKYKNLRLKVTYSHSLPSGLWKMRADGSNPLEF